MINKEKSGLEEMKTLAGFFAFNCNDFPLVCVDSATGTNVQIIGVTPMLHMIVVVWHFPPGRVT